MIFFSMHYPFHYSDSYLDEEINYLAQSYEKVIIVSSNIHTLDKRPMPSNSVLYRYNPFQSFKSSKLSAIFQIFSPFVWKEIYLLLFKYHRVVTFTLLKEILLNFKRISHTRKNIQKIWKEQNLSKSENLIYSYWMLEPCVAAALGNFKSKNSIFISKAHSQDVYFFRNYYHYQPFKYQAFKNIDHVFFISDDAKNYFAKAHHLNALEVNRLSVNRVGVIGPGHFIEGRHDGPVKIISIAWIHTLKRIELIIEALALIQDITIEWTHLGASVEDTYSYKVFELAKLKLKNAKNIRYTFKGETGKEELRRLFSDENFDFLINVSTTEGIPVSMMEAASYSVPLLGTNVGGVSEIIKDGFNGYLLDENIKPENLAQKISTFAQLSPDNKNLLRKGAFETWDNYYSVDRNKKELKNKIDKLYDEKR